MMPHKLKIPTIAELKNTLSQYVVGQPELIDVLISVIYRHIYKIIGNFIGKVYSSNNLLVIGHSGTGKTYTIKKLASILNIPFIEINGPSINQEGWHGDSLIGLISKGIKPFQNTESRAYPIIYIDEFDKLCAPQGSSNTLNHSLFIQASILKYIEGMKIKINEVEYDTSMFCFIFSGSFNGMGVVNKNDIGFVSNSAGKPVYQKKLKDYGVLDELIGRLTRIVRTNDFTSEMYRELVCNSKSSFNEWFEFFRHIGINRITEPNWTALIQQAVELNLGARGLNNLLEPEIDRLIEYGDLQYLWNKYVNSGTDVSDKKVP